jgi:dTDP-glucose 4,6-dehydratase
MPDQIILMKLLITGGSGFIGSNFILQERRADENLVIINLDKLTYAGNLETLVSLESDPNYVFIQGDIGDRQLVGQLLESYQPDAIVNFAAETHVDRSIDESEPFIKTNIVGTFLLLEETRIYWRNLSSHDREHFRFVHISTDEVFGSLGLSDPPFTETSPYAPNNPYSASKASSDHLVRTYFQTYGLPTLIANCSNNYGPCQFPEKLIPLMTLSAIAGQALPIYGDGQNVRDWLYVADHCRAIQLILKKGRPGESYNIGGASERSNQWIVHKLCTILDSLLPNSPYTPHASLMTYVEDRPGHDKRYATNFNKLKNETGWSPVESIESGLRKTVQWYLDHRDWCHRVTAHKYSLKRLGIVEMEREKATTLP